MPKATMSHRDKKDGHAHDAWVKRKKALRETGTFNKVNQRIWRINCLKAKLDNNESLTGKQMNEAIKLKLVRETTE